MFALYVGGIFSAMAVAQAVLKLWRGTVRPTPLIMELPPYRLPALRSLAQGLYERASIFIKRRAASSWPVGAAVGAVHPFRRRPRAPLNQPSTTAWRASWAARWSRCSRHLGFNWQIAVALVPAMAAREVVVSALGTVYALSATGDEVAAQLAADRAAVVAGHGAVAAGVVCLCAAVHCHPGHGAARDQLLAHGPCFMASYMLRWPMPPVATYHLTVALGG